MNKNTCLAALFMLSSHNVLAVNSYDPATGVLKLDSVVVNDTQFNDVEVKLKAYDLIRIGGSQSSGNVSDGCTDANFTVDKYNAITQGMSVDKVNQIIGCKFDPAETAAGGGIIIHYWKSPSNISKFISVYFSEFNNLVWGFSPFKIRSGF